MLPYALLFFKLYNSSTVLTHFLMAAQHTPAQGEGEEGEGEREIEKEDSQRSVRNEETAQTEGDKKRNDIVIGNRCRA